MSFEKDWWTKGPKKIVSHVVKVEQIKATKSEDLPELLDTKEAAVFMRKHYKTVEELRHKKKLKFLKMGGRYFTTPEFIAMYLENCKV